MASEAKKAEKAEQYTATDEDRARVLALSGFGLLQDQIRLLIKNPKTGKPINRRTLAKYYPHELAAGKGTAIAAVAQSLYQKALAKGPQSVAAAIFFLKAQGEWKERHEFSGPNNTPLVSESPADKILKALALIAARKDAAKKK